MGGRGIVLEVAGSPADENCPLPLSRTITARSRQGRCIGFRAFAHSSSEFAGQMAHVQAMRRPGAACAGKIRASARQGGKNRARPALAWVSPGACGQGHCPHRMPPVSRTRPKGGDPPSPALRRPCPAHANSASPRRCLRIVTTARRSDWSCRERSERTQRLLLLPRRRLSRGRPVETPAHIGECHERAVRPQTRRSSIAAGIAAVPLSSAICQRRPSLQRSTFLAPWTIRCSRRRAFANVVVTKGLDV